MVWVDGLMVAVGATIGGLARKGIVDVAGAAIGPWHIAAINIGGSAVLGAIAADEDMHPRHKLLLGVGACGAFTTFSTFAVDVVALVEAEQLAKAAGYVALNNVGSIGGAYGAFKARRAFAPPKARPPRGPAP